MEKIAEIIKYEGNNDAFIWKHPIEDFTTGAQLIVHESQEAVFFMNGQALDLFGPGRHTLETQNLPLVSRLFSRATGGKTPFHCEVYFINKTEQMAIKWGTDSKVEYIDPAYGFPIQLGASGEMALLAADSRKLLVKVVGAEKGITQAGLVQKLRGFLMMHIKTYLGQLIKAEKINVFEIDEHLEKISQQLREKLTPDFLDYGVSLERFFVTNIVKPEEDRAYRKFKDLHFRQYADVAEAKLRQQTNIIDAQTEAQKTVIASQAMAAKRAQEGYTYQQERGYDVAEKVAQNQATGELANIGVGMGMISGVGGTLGAAVGGVMQNAMGNVAAGALGEEAVCPKCGRSMPRGAKFCLECGTNIQESSASQMVCPHCGKNTPKGKFCMECGGSLVSQCPKCGADLPENAKFCLECGEKL